jgi:hypothetical protein
MEATRDSNSINAPFKLKHPEISALKIKIDTENMKTYLTDNYIIRGFVVTVFD